ncbi:MAG: MarR family winged helix-turn-helix transcriptional regulator [Geminicoccaceae bacterium]
MPSIDHLGWRLWCASQTWKEQYLAGMLASGHDWYAEARSSIIPYLDREGTRQVVLVERMGLSKQAVQQLVDDLESEGIVERRPDPADRRGKIVAFTQKGMKAQSDANRVKREVEADFCAKLGARDFAKLDELLRRLAEK